MKFIAEKDALVGPLATVSGAADTRGTLPILGSVLLKTVDGKLSMLCSDSGMVARSLAGCQIQMPGETVVELRRFHDLVKAIPDKTVVEITAADNSLTLKAGRSRFKLPTLKPEDYPRMSISKDHRIAVKLDAKRVEAMIDQVADAMALNDTRTFLNGAQIGLEHGGLWMTATDGHRMHVAFEPVPGLDGQEPVSLIVPRRTVVQMRRLLSQGGSATLTLSAGDIQLTMQDGSVLIGKSIDGRFPAWRSIIPAKGFTGNASTTHLRNAITMLQTTVVQTNKKDTAAFLASRLSITFDKGMALLERGEDGRCEFDGTTDSPEPIGLGINIDYMKSAIEAIGAGQESVRIGYTDSVSAITVRPLAGDFPLAVVMPVRI